jgi:DsbC/DsbD-like thiol-disulfide interchange protein
MMESSSALKIRNHLSTFLVLTAITLFAVPARSEIVSGWSEGLGARARLIAGATTDGTRAGIQIILEDGWKTYWRNPGDGGIPPVFNWAGSQNLASANVQFPTPQRYQDSYGTSMGYKHSVVFPISLQIIDPARPVVISVRMDYAVCEKLCVPAQADLLLEIPANLSVGYSLGLQQSLEQVPAGRGVEDALIESLQIASSGEESWFEISARYPGEPADLDLFVEGPESWYLPAPMQISRTVEGPDTLVAFRVDLNGLPRNARLEDARLLFTIVADNRSVEQRWILD